MGLFLCPKIAAENKATLADIALPVSTLPSVDPIEGFVVSNGSKRLVSSDNKEREP